MIKVSTKSCGRDIIAANTLPRLEMSILGLSRKIITASVRRASRCGSREEEVILVVLRISLEDARKMKNGGDKIFKKTRDFEDRKVEKFNEFLS